MAGDPNALRNDFETLATRETGLAPPVDGAHDAPGNGAHDAHTSLDPHPSPQAPLFRRHAPANRPIDLARCLADEEAARLMMERLRWPAVTICPHCTTLGASRRLNTTMGRAGLWRCGNCGRQFTVTVGTALSSTRIPLHLWIYSIHMLCSSNRGLSAGEVARELGVSYNSARALLQRILGALDPSDEEASDDEGSDNVRRAQRRQRIDRVSLRPRTVPEVCERLLNAG